MNHLARILLLLPALTLCSCMTFEKDWNAAVAEYESGKVSSPEGPWEGSWFTKTNGHSGDLRAIVSKSDDKPGEYDFRYHATWGKIFSGSYTVDYPVKRRGSRTLVDGSENLGPFGTFHHKATITPSLFKATYSSDKEALGSFEMKRPES